MDGCRRVDERECTLTCLVIWCVLRRENALWWSWVMVMVSMVVVVVMMVVLLTLMVIATRSVTYLPEDISLHIVRGKGQKRSSLASQVLTGPFGAIMNVAYLSFVFL